MALIFSSPELKASGELMDRQLSVVVCRLSTHSNDISSEATGWLGPNFYLYHPWAEGLKACGVFMNIDCGNLDFTLTYNGEN